MITKIDNNTAEFEKVIPQAINKVVFERGYLEQQKKAIIAQRDEFAAARQKELDEIDGYLAEMDKLGIVKKEVVK